MVLLKNGDDDGTAFATTATASNARGVVLPLDVSSLAGKTVAVIGPNGGCAGDPNAPNARCDGTSAGGCQAQCSLIGKTFHEIGDGVRVPTVYETISAGVPKDTKVGGEGTTGGWLTFGSTTQWRVGSSCADGRNYEQGWLCGRNEPHRVGSSRRVGSA